MFLFILIDLLFNSVETLIDRFFKSFATTFGNQFAAGDIHFYDGHFIAQFIVFVDFQVYLRGETTLNKPIHFVHLVLNEVDESLVGIKLYGLNLHFHNYPPYLF